MSETKDFALIESMLYERGYQRLDRHLARMKAAALELGFPFSEIQLLQLLEQQAGTLVAAGDGRHKVRLLLEPDGSAWIDAERLGTDSPPAEVMLAADNVHSASRLARFKTTERAVFDRYAPMLLRHALADVLFLNERAEVAEASRSNVFVESDGELLTPPVSAGILPGVYRGYVLESDERAREEVLTVADLERATAVYLCNSVRGWRQVTVRPGLLSLQDV